MANATNLSIRIRRWKNGFGVQHKLLRSPASELYGFTYIEMIILGVVLTLGATITHVGLTKSEGVYREITCCSNLKTLASACNSYASDNNEKYFYHWTESSWSLNPGREPIVRAWWANEIVGQYIPASPFARNTADDDAIAIDRRGKVQSSKQEIIDIGLGGGSLACPQDAAAARSYNLNFWVSGIDYKLPLPEFLQGNIKNRGELKSPDQMVLFAEQVALTLGYKSSMHGQGIPTPENAYWLVSGMLASKGDPYDLFRAQKVIDSLAVARRFGAPRRISSQIDFSRHSGHDFTLSNTTPSNFAVADGSVKGFSRNDLFNPGTMRLTGKLNWYEE